MWMSSSIELFVILTIFCGILWWVIFLEWEINALWETFKKKSHLGNSKYLPPPWNDFFPSTLEVGEINGLWFLSVVTKIIVLTQRTVKIHSGFLENKALTLPGKSFWQYVNPKFKAHLFRHLNASFFLFLCRIRKGLGLSAQYRHEDSE